MWATRARGHLSQVLQISGPSRRLLRTPFDGSIGISRMGPLCWGCLYGILRIWWKGTSLACSPFLPSIPALSLDKGLSLTILRLFCSLCLQPKYNRFRSRLEKSLPLLDGLTLSTTNDEAIDAVLKVLQVKREREKVEAEQEEDRDEM